MSLLCPLWIIFSTFARKFENIIINKGYDTLLSDTTEDCDRH